MHTQNCRKLTDRQTYVHTHARTHARTHTHTLPTQHNPFHNTTWSCYRFSLYNNGIQLRARLPSDGVDILQGLS